MSRGQRYEGLTEEHLKAAELLVKGKTEEQVAKECGRSKVWVAKLKTRADFKMVMEELRQTIKEAQKKQLVEKLNPENLPEIQEFRKQTLNAAKLIHDTAIAYLVKIQARIDDLEIEEIKGEKVGLALKQASEAIVVSAELGKQVLGIDQLVEEITSVQKAGSIGTKTTPDV